MLNLALRKHLKNNMMSGYYGENENIQSNDEPV